SQQLEFDQGERGVGPGAGFDQTGNARVRGSLCRRAAGACMLDQLGHELARHRRGKAKLGGQAVESVLVSSKEQHGTLRNYAASAAASLRWPERHKETRRMAPLPHRDFIKTLRQFENVHRSARRTSLMFHLCRRATVNLESLCLDR